MAFRTFRALAFATLSLGGDTHAGDLVLFFLGATDFWLGAAFGLTAMVFNAVVFLTKEAEFTPEGKISRLPT